MFMAVKKWHMFLTKKRNIIDIIGSLDLTDKDLELKEYLIIF